MSVRRFHPFPEISVMLHTWAITDVNFFLAFGTLNKYRYVPVCIWEGGGNTG